MSIQPSLCSRMQILLKDADFLGTELGLKYLILFPLLATYQLLSVDMLAVLNAQSWLLFSLCASHQVNLFIPRYVNYVYDFQIYICKLQTHVSNCLLMLSLWIFCRYSQINGSQTKLVIIQLVYLLQLHITNFTSLLVLLM